MHSLRIAVTILLFAVGLIGLAAVQPANGQRRDYLTDAEVELVRDAQQIDLRVAVITIAIDRRFQALGVRSQGPVNIDKLDSKWGDPPTGSRIELYTDIKRLLQKAIDDIDDVAAHAANPRSDPDVKEKDAKREAQRFPNAVRLLAASAKRYEPILKAEMENTKGEIDKGPILDSIDFCDQIIEAAATLPTDQQSDKKKISAKPN